MLSNIYSPLILMMLVVCFLYRDYRLDMEIFILRDKSTLDDSDIQVVDKDMSEEACSNCNDLVEIVASPISSDGCGLNPRDHSVRANWTFASEDAALMNWLRDVKACGNRFALVDIKFFGGFDENRNVCS